MINLSNNFDHTTVGEWIESTFPNFPEEHLEQFLEVHEDLIDAVGRIIALQIAIVTIRGTGGICQSNPDYLVELLNEKQIEFGKSFPEFEEINPNYFF